MLVFLSVSETRQTSITLFTLAWFSRLYCTTMCPKARYGEQSRCTGTYKRKCCVLAKCLKRGTNSLRSHIESFLHRRFLDFVQVWNFSVSEFLLIQVAALRGHLCTKRLQWERLDAALQTQWPLTPRSRDRHVSRTLVLIYCSALGWFSSAADFSSVAAVGARRTHVHQI